MDKKVVFVTGVTGLVGSYLTKLLLQNDHKVYVLARGKDNKSAKERVIEVLKFWDENVLDKIDNLVVIEGDIVYPNFGIKQKNILDLLKSETEIIFHCAALTTFRAPLEQMRKINVEGTKNVLDFALECKNLKKVNHISTAFVVGNKEGINFSEDMLNVGQGFNNTYEQSKYEAEVLAREYQQKRDLNISIFRPSIIMGDTKEGKTNNFHLFYEPLHFFSQGIYEEFPMDLKCTLNLINIDTVANAILILQNIESPMVYHIVSPNEITQKFLKNLSSKYFGFKMPKFIPLDKFDFSKWSPAQKFLAIPFIPYCNYKVKFLSQKTQAILQKYGFVYPKIDEKNLLKIFEYCNKIGFIKRIKT